MIFAVIGAMGAVGSIIYLQVYNVLLKSYQNAAWLSFGVIVLIDGLMLIFLLIMISFGKFGHAAAGTEDEDAEVGNIRGPDAGPGGYADIPDLAEVEEDEAEYENTTHKGSLVESYKHKESKVNRESLAKGSLN